MALLNPDPAITYLGKKKIIDFKILFVEKLLRTRIRILIFENGRIRIRSIVEQTRKKYISGGMYF